MDISRKTFIGSALSALAFGGCRMAGATAKVPEYGFKWIDLVHLGMKMWGDLPMNEPPKRDGIMTKVLTDEEYDAIWRNPDILAKDRVYFDEPFWRELSARLRESGCNCILLDVGEALRYPSHPELAVKGSWSPEKLRAEILRLRGMGFEVLPSQANFVFARHPGSDGGELYRALKQRGVLVRHFDAPRISDYLRITIGTEEQMDRLYGAINEILGG